MTSITATATSNGSKYGNGDINHHQPPSDQKYNKDTLISLERILEAHHAEWPLRQNIEVPEFAADADPKDVVEGIKKAGGCIIRKIVSPESLARIEKDIRPHLEADTPWEADTFFPPTTKRAFGLIGKSRAFALDVVGNELYQAVCDEFLTTRGYPYFGNRNIPNMSRPHVNNAIAFSVRPGNSFDQPLHRDDDIHSADRPRIERYPVQTNSRDYGMGLFVAVKKSTKANGATRFIPGSHLEATIQPLDEDFAVHAELEPGDGFILLSSCYHGGSANTTEDEECLLVSCFMTRGWLRQEENQYLAVPIEVARTLPVRIQRLMGYQQSGVTAWNSLSLDYTNIMC